LRIDPGLTGQIPLTGKQAEGRSSHSPARSNHRALVKPLQRPRIASAQLAPASVRTENKAGATFRQEGTPAAIVTAGKGNNKVGAVYGQM